MKKKSTDILNILYQMAELFTTFKNCIINILRDHITSCNINHAS